MSVKETFKAKTATERVGYMAGKIWGRAFANAEAAFECLGHLGQGNRAGLERDANLAIGMNVQRGQTLNHRPHQLDARELAESTKPKSSLRKAFEAGKAAGVAAKVTTAPPKPRPGGLKLAPT